MKFLRNKLSLSLSLCECVSTSLYVLKIFCSERVEDDKDDAAALVVPMQSKVKQKSTNYPILIIDIVIDLNSLSPRSKSSVTFFKWRQSGIVRKREKEKWNKLERNSWNTWMTQIQTQRKRGMCIPKVHEDMNILRFIAIWNIFIGTAYGKEIKSEFYSKIMHKMSNRNCDLIKNFVIHFFLFCSVFYFVALLSSSRNRIFIM